MTAGPVKVSVAVMAHPKREAFVPSLLEALDRPATVVWDQRNDRWDTGRRAMLAYDAGATHHLVIQDDAIVCRDLVAGLEAALVHVPPDAPVCLYVGRLTPFADQTTAAAQRATADGTAWLTIKGLHWGVGIVMPTGLIEAMCHWGDTRGAHVANYDKRISRWLETRRQTTWYPWPSLVDHRDSPSLVPGRGSRGRFAHRFLGTRRSALDVDWSAGVTNVELLRRFGSRTRTPRSTKETSPVVNAKPKGTISADLMTPRRNVTIHRDRRRYRLKIGETVAHRTSWIVTEKPDLWKPLVVHYPSESAALATGGVIADSPVQISKNGIVVNISGSIPDEATLVERIRAAMAQAGHTANPHLGHELDADAVAADVTAEGDSAEGDADPAGDAVEPAPTAGAGDTVDPGTPSDVPPATKPKAKDVRAWAKKEGIEGVPARGPIPDDIVERYQAAHQGTDW